MISSDKEYPRVLVISSTPFSKTKNNGKTLASFFKEYPKENIAQLSFGYDDTNNDICNNYFFVSTNDLRFGNRGNQLSEYSINHNTNQKGAIYKLFHKLSIRRNPLTVLYKNHIWKKNLNKMEQMYEWIDKFKPNIVFFQAFSQAYGLDVTLSICQKFKLPLILQITDDYTVNIYPCSLLNNIITNNYTKQLAILICYSKKTIVISELMKSEYEKKFGGDMMVVMNLSKKTACLARENNGVDFVYAGSLYLNRWKVLLNVGKALILFNKNAKLHIYSHEIPDRKIRSKLLKIESIKIEGFLDSSQLESRLSKCDYVVHVESFDRRTIKQTRLSVSTKISEYLSSGAKILAVGPEKIASMKMIEEYELGLLVKNYKPKTIYQVLKDDFSSNSTSFDKREKVFDMYAGSDIVSKIHKLLINHSKK